MHNRPSSLSIVIPLFNEEQVLDLLITRLDQVIQNLGIANTEVVFCDDGSTDRTLEKLKAVAEKKKNIKILSLSRNFGHQTALSAAFDHVSGEVVVVMDGDLQDPPEVLTQFLEQYQLGYDVVYGRRESRAGGLFLRAAYFLFYRLIRAVSDLDLPLDSGDFCLMSRRVVLAINKMPERHRYIRGLRTWAGFKQIGISIHRPERASGESKYTFGKLLKLAFDGIFAFSSVPLRLAAIIGAISLVLVLGFVFYSVIALLLGWGSPKGFTATTLLIGFTFSVQMLFLGLLGEYVSRIYEETKGRPHYLLKEKINL